MRRALRILVPLLFVLAWAPTLTPLHRLYGFGGRTALIGVIEGILLCACVAAIFGAGKRQGSSVRIVAAACAGWIALTVLTAAVEPARGRSRSARHLSPAAESGTRSAAPRRVLLLCVDGLDWNAIDRLVAERQLPFLARVLSRARTYEVDNHGSGLSPGLWARAYSGAAEPIQGFTKWTLRDIAVLPQWRHRPIFMLDAALTAGARLHLWDATSPTNADFVHAPLWRVASAAHVPVGVFDPLPFDVAGEQVNGFFAWQADDGFRVAVSNEDGGSSVERIRDETSSDSEDDVIRGEAIRAGIAAHAFSRVRPDIGIYYTHVLDAIGHMIWEPGAFPMSTRRGRNARGLCRKDASRERIGQSMRRCGRSRRASANQQRSSSFRTTAGNSTSTRTARHRWEPPSSRAAERADTAARCR